MGDSSLNDEHKILKIKRLFEETGAKEATRQSIFYHSDLAINELEKTTINVKQKQFFSIERLVDQPILLKKSLK